MDNGLFTFRTLFEKALFDTCHLSFRDYALELNKEITYCFELTTPYNRIVVNYPNNGITLLSARAMSNYEELDIAEVLTYGVPKVKKYLFTSIENLIEWVSTLNPIEHEGVVILDSKFNRRKVKNAAYCAYSRLRDTLGTSERNCMELILLEKDDDAIPFLPEEIVKNLYKIKASLQKAIALHDDTYYLIKGVADIAQLGDKKTFALLVKKTMKLAQEKGKPIWQAPFFQMFDGKATSMKDFIMKNRKDGTWGSSFLDRILELSKR
jgi:hypothetical protein